MTIKNIVCMLVAAIICMQPIKAEDQPAPMSNRELARKTGKILLYSAELASTIFAYSALQIIGWDLRFARNDSGQWKVSKTMLPPTLQSIATNYKAKEYKAMNSCVLFQVPFIAAAVHATHGLGSELPPVAKAAWHKIRTKKA